MRKTCYLMLLLLLLMTMMMSSPRHFRRFVCHCSSLVVRFGHALDVLQEGFQNESFDCHSHWHGRCQHQHGRSTSH